MLRQLQRGSLQKLSRKAAEAAVGAEGLPQAEYYYLIRVGYVGSAPAGTIPVGISIGTDVDVEGTAYVSSFGLSRSRTTSEFAAILASSRHLTRVISTCGAAE
jgi:hypothetical protein